MPLVNGPFFRTACVVLALALGGCVAPPVEAPQEPPSVDGLTVLPFGLNECAFAVAVVPVDAEALARYIPEGFQLREGGALLPNAGGAQALLGLEAFECAGEGLGGGTDPYAYAGVFAAVVPPETLASGSIEEYYVKWDALVANATKRAALAEAGYPARAGEVSIEVSGAGPAARVTASVRMEGAGGFSMSGAGPIGGPRSGFEYVEYVPGEDGTFAAWRSRTLDRESVASARGSITVDASSWYGELTGAGPIPASIATGRWSFAPGNITFPVRTIADVR